MTEALKPCPFCGSEDVYSYDPEWVTCPNCGAEGPPEVTCELAIKSWNCRASPSSEVQTDPEALRVIADCACRFDGLDPSQAGMMVYDDDGKQISAREFYGEYAAAMVETLGRHGYQIFRRPAS